MMYKIFKDLEQHIKAIYSGSNVITLNKLLHHSFKYNEMVELFSKYKGDSEKVLKLLNDHIVTYETNEATSNPVKKRKTIGLGNDFFEEIIEQSFGHNLMNELNQNLVYTTTDVQQVFKLAEQFEIKKLQRQANETGQVAQPTDISLSSFLRAVIHLVKSNQKFAHILTIFKESKFDIEKFVKDDDTGKSATNKVIKELCTNLNEKALNNKLQEVIGREVEIEQLVNILKKARKNNPVLTGKAGVGKTAIVEGLAKRIVEGKVPEALKNAVIYELQPMNMVKGTQFRGSFEQKMSDLLEEFREKEESGELPILFIDELHTIMGAGNAGQGSLDFSNIIKPALARGELRTIGATTTDEWYKFIKENSALDRRFISVEVKEPSFEDSLKIITGSLSFYEKNHNVKYQDGVVQKAIELSNQFIVDNALPDKAFDLIDYSGAMCAVNGKSVVTKEDVEIALARHKNIALDAIVESRKDNMEPLAKKLKEVIFGQDQAIDAIVRPVQKALAGLNAKDKPYGAFLFTGPTGTGKTELAKQIAKVMKANFHRLDMSEFKEAHSVAKLIGSPAGYVGYDDGSILTKVINQNPRTVLLLDEIEKAHPDVHKLFLQVMDYGKLTDSKGKEINFKNVLLIMTSNVGVKMRTKQIGLSEQSDKQIDSSVVEANFPPEFRARLTGNGFIEFKALTLDMMKKIVLKYVKEVQEERLDKLNIELKLTDEVVNSIAKEGLDKQLGARPVKDLIEYKIIDQLTDLVLFGNLKNLKTKKTVTIEKDGDNFIIK